MKISHIIAVVTFAGVCACSSALAWDQDPFAQYIQRSETITLGAGNAKDVNAATHVMILGRPMLEIDFFRAMASGCQTPWSATAT